METNCHLFSIYGNISLHGIFDNCLVLSAVTRHRHIYVKPFISIYISSRYQLDRVLCRSLFLAMVKTEQRATGHWYRGLCRWWNSKKAGHNHSKYKLQSYRAISKSWRAYTGDAWCVQVHATSLVCWLVLVVDWYTNCHGQSDLYGFVRYRKLEIFPRANSHRRGDASQFFSTWIRWIPGTNV